MGYRAPSNIARTTQPIIGKRYRIPIGGVQPELSLLIGPLLQQRIHPSLP
jgi:hypothetical protein